MKKIHQTAVVAAGAEIGDGVQIGPYAIIGEKVHLGSNAVVGPHAIIDGDTILGDDCVVYSQASIGSKSQDLKDTEGGGKLVIGKGNVFREFVTINAGTPGGAESRHSATGIF